MEFNFDKFSTEVKNEVLTFIMGKNFKPGLTWNKLVNWEFKLEMDQIYLAWLWANGFVISNGNDASVDSKFDFNYDNYEVPDDAGGINILHYFQYYKLNEIAHLLKE